MNSFSVPENKGPSPYSIIAAQGKSQDLKGAGAPSSDLLPTGGTYSANGKAENGVSYRKPYDPNGCSAECKQRRLEKYGF